VEMLMEMREVIMIWNIIITIVMAVVGFFMKEKFNEIQRLNILLNRTREEIARDSVTQAEVDKILDHIDQRFNKLEDKINQLIAR
jgi:archaellum component FlaC